jgi:DNA-binding CsgD family transcriptional regulator
VAFATRAEPELSGTEQVNWFGRLEAEHPNFRAALAWRLDQGDADEGLRLACGLAWFWSSRGYFREARRWFEAFLAMPASPIMRGRGLLDAANILHWQGDNSQATNCAEESLALCRDHGDRSYELYALRRLASLAIDGEEHDRAGVLLTRSRALVRSVGSAWDAVFDIFLTGRLAAAARRDGEARGHFAEAASAFRGIGDRGYVAAALGQLGAAALRDNDLFAARDAYAESLELAHDLQDQPSIAWALEGAAHLAQAGGEAAIATRLLAASSAMREAIGEARLLHATLQSAVRAALGDQGFANEWERGWKLSKSEAVAVARAILAGFGSNRQARDELATAARARLTQREQDVLRLVVAGRADKEIAATLAISRATVSRHVASIRAKLGAPSRSAAAAIAVRDRLVETQ